MCHVLHSQLFNIFSLLILINFERLLPVSPFIPLKIEKQSRGGLLFTQSITRLGMREAGCTLRPDSGTAALLPTRCTVCTLHFRVCVCVCACVHARGERGKPARQGGIGMAHLHRAEESAQEE